jgi:hypothetical protein
MTLAIRLGLVLDAIGIRERLDPSFEREHPLEDEARAANAARLRGDEAHYRAVEGDGAGRRRRFSESRSAEQADCDAPGSHSCREHASSWHDATRRDQHYCDRFSVAGRVNVNNHAKSDHIASRPLPADNESTGLAGTSRGSSSFVPIAI